MLSDAGGGVGYVEFRVLDDVPHPVQAPPHLDKLRFDVFQPLPLVAGHPVHLLVQQLHQVSDVALGKDVLPYLVDLVAAERVAGRVLVYATHTGTRDITERMDDIFTRHGFRVAVMKADASTAYPRVRPVLLPEIIPALQRTDT